MGESCGEARAFSTGIGRRLEKETGSPDGGL